MTREIFQNCRRILRLGVLLGVLLAAQPAHAQHASPAPADSARIRLPLTLEETIRAAQEQSLDAMMAKYSFLSSYWSFRSFRASRLPSLNISGNLFALDRSMGLIQDYDSGELRYIENYNLQNNIGLSISQNIALTGGTLQLYSSLNRLDQFSPQDATSYYSQPLTLSYTQPLFAYNQFNWDKKIAPKECERAKRGYIEAMEQVTAKAVSYYISLLLSKTSYEIAMKNYDNTCTLYAIAQERIKLGTITQDELLQLQLRMLNDSLTINTSSLQLREQQILFNSYLRYNDRVDVEPLLDRRIPVVDIDYVMVIEKALENSSFTIDNEIQMLTAESEVARARAERGATASFNARFGLSQTGDKFRTAYSNLLDQEVIGLSFSIPIFDWGMGKGRVRMARARSELVRSQIEQEEVDFRREIYTLLEQFHNQRNQCAVAERALEVAERRYSVAMENFRQSKISVSDMNIAQSEKDQANQTFITALSDFWNCYYSLRAKTLYDFITHTDISAAFDNLIQDQNP